MLDEARRWAETQFGTADLGDARRTHRLVSTMAAIARAPDESLPRRELAATTRLARQHQGGVPAVRLWGGHPHGRHGPACGPACRAVPRRGGAASDRPHGPRRHDPRFLAASYAQ